MKIKTFMLGLFQTNCYLLSCEKSQEAVIIDPPDSDSQLTDYIKQNKLKLQYILLTHGHIDHIGGVAYVKENSNAKILMHRADLSLVENVSVYAQWFDMDPPPLFKIDDFLAENQIIAFGTIKLKVLFTPGHTPGGVCFIHEANAFVGDTLFAGSIGRTDLPGGDYDTIIASIKNKLLILDESTTVFSGHGPETNIKIEKESNPFLND
jgi:glyoxylase-like metal-dependent hydrolase (beta-lactamase superfamily II)